MSKWRESKKESNVAVYDQADTDKIKELLLWKKVVKVSENTLQLSDGTILEVGGNDGGCSCSAGDYDLTELNGTDNIITNVEFDYNPAGDSYDYDYSSDGDGYYRVFVYSGNQKIKLLEVEGSDGNGYYGTGYWIAVKRPLET